MYDVKELEEQWKQYDRRRKRPVIVFTILGLLVSGIIFYLYSNGILNKLVDQVILSHSTMNEVNSTVKSVALVEKNISKADVLEKKEFNIEVSSSEEPQEKKKFNIEVSSSLKEVKPYEMAQLEPILEESKPLSYQNKKENLKLDIADRQDEAAYKDVERRFYETRDTADSLFLARHFYMKGEYKKAEYWALQTNKIDDTLEEAWLLFAQAKAKMGEKKKAIKALKAYIQRSDSLRAKRLLDQIQ